MEWARDDGFVVTDDQRRLDIERIHHWLSDESYWATGSSLDRVATSIDHSITLGCLDPDGTQVGVTRLVSDHATFALVTDVFVDTDYRGRGLGKFLVQSALNHPAARDVRRLLLITKDAHGLYRQFGFAGLSNPERWMELRPSGS